MQNLTVEYIAISELKPYENNPRVHKSKQIEQIVKSITEFKFNTPILLDEKNEILAGHGRLLAAQNIGMAN